MSTGSWCWASTVQLFHYFFVGAVRLVGASASSKIYVFAAVLGSRRAVLFGGVCLLWVISVEKVLFVFYQLCVKPLLIWWCPSESHVMNVPDCGATRIAVIGYFAIFSYYVFGLLGVSLSGREAASC